MFLFAASLCESFLNCTAPCNYSQLLGTDQLCALFCLAVHRSAVGSLAMISTASYAARAFGVRSAMPGFVAKQLCPQLIFVDHDGASYEAAASQARAVFAQYDPSFVSGSLDEASLNLTAYLAREGVYPAGDASETHEHMQPGRPPNTAELEAIEGVVSQLRTRVFDATGGLTCSAGIAPNHLLAKICSDLNKPNGQTLCPFNGTGVVELMKGLPCRKIPGVGRVTERELAELGVTVCGDIGARLGVISAALGERTAQWLARCALGLTETSARSFGESGASDGDVGRKSISQERTFSDTHSWAELSSRCRDLSAAVAAQLRSEGLLTSCVTVKGKLHTFEVLQHGHSLPRPTDDAETIAAAAVDLLREACSSGGDKNCRIFRLLGVRLSALTLAVPKPTLLDSFLLAQRRPGARPLAPASRCAMDTGSAVAGDIVDLSGLGDGSCSDSDGSGDCVMLYHWGPQTDAGATSSAAIRSGGTLAAWVVPATELAGAGNANHRTSSRGSDLSFVGPVPVRPWRDAKAATGGCAPPAAALQQAQCRAAPEPDVIIASDSEPEDSAQAPAPTAAPTADLPGSLALPVAPAGRSATGVGSLSDAEPATPNQIATQAGSASAPMSLPLPVALPVAVSQATAAGVVSGSGDSDSEEGPSIIRQTLPVAQRSTRWPATCSLSAHRRPGPPLGTAGAQRAGAAADSAKSPSEVEPDSESPQPEAASVLASGSAASAQPVARRLALPQAVPPPRPPASESPPSSSLSHWQVASVASFRAGSGSLTAIGTGSGSSGRLLPLLQAGPPYSGSIAELASASPPSNALVLCPVCGRMLPSLQSERHIDVCLQRKKRKRQNAASVFKQLALPQQLHSAM